MEGIEKKKLKKKNDNKTVSKLLSLSETLDNLKENIILAGTSWNEVFCRNATEIYDSQTFSLLEILPSSRAQNKIWYPHSHIERVVAF